MEWWWYTVLSCGLLALLFLAARQSIVLCNLASVSFLLCSAVIKRFKLTLRVKWHKYVRPYKPVAGNANNPANHAAPHIIMRRPQAKVKGQ